MWLRLNKLYRRCLGQPATATPARPPRPRQIRTRLSLERLEERTLLSNYTARTVPELIVAINAANQTAEVDSIALIAGRTFTLTEVDNTTNGRTGLPTIVPNGGNLTILGNGDIIERSTAAGTPAFRLFDVAAGASLTLENLTLQGGLASDSGAWSASGGALLNHDGAVTLRGVTVQNNIAIGSGLDQVAGGGIYSRGSLIVQGGRIQNNQAVGGTFALGGGVLVAGTASFTDVIVSSNTARGGDGGDGSSGGIVDLPTAGGPGGHALGGGLFVANYYTTVSLTGVTLSSNTARGGDGGDKATGYKAGDGGNGFGGGLYAESYTTVTVRNSSVSQNSALGGAAGKGGGGNRGQGVGGGLCFDASVDSPAFVCLDAFTVSNVKKNKASTSHPNIHGWYTICS